MTVSCVPPCLFKGIKPPKNLELQHDMGEWKEKACVSIGPMHWSPEKRMMYVTACQARILMEMENDSHFINFRRNVTGQRRLALKH